MYSIPKLKKIFTSIYIDSKDKDNIFFLSNFQSKNSLSFYCFRNVSDVTITWMLLSPPREG